VLLNNIISVITLKRMRWAGHVAHMGKGEVYTVFWWGKPEEKYQLEDPGIDGRMILRCICRKWDGRHVPDGPGSGYG